MKKSIKFSSLYLICAIAAAAVYAAAAIIFAIFGGNSVAHFTASNINTSIVVKALVAAVLVFALVLIYFAIRFKKPGIKIAIFSTLGAVCSALFGLAFCIICRASLSDYTFAVALMGVCLSYMTSALFYSRMDVKLSRKKNAEISESNFDEVASAAFAPMLAVLVIILVVLVGAFVTCVVFENTFLMLYALPTLLTAVLSVVVTLAVFCRIYAKKA